MARESMPIGDPSKMIAKEQVSSAQFFKGEMPRPELAEMPVLELSPETITERKDLLREKALEYRQRKQKKMEKLPKEYRQNLIFRDAFAKQLLADQLVARDRVDPQRIFNALQDYFSGDYTPEEFQEAYVVIKDYVETGGMKVTQPGKKGSRAARSPEVPADDKNSLKLEQLNQEIRDKKNALQREIEFYQSSPDARHQDDHLVFEKKQAQIDALIRERDSLRKG